MCQSAVNSLLPPKSFKHLPYLLIGKFETKNMFEILRHEESGICMDGSFVSAGSQVSL